MAKRIITISREFGSGGRFIGEEVAKKLGIAYYDKDIIGQIAERSGFSEKCRIVAKERIICIRFSGAGYYRKISGRYGIRSAEKGDPRDRGEGKLRDHRKKCGLYLKRQRGCAECFHTRKHAGKSKTYL